jgi:hypothetical protein
MALANARIRVFQTVKDLENFIRTDVAITSIVSVSQDNSGAYILVYNVA